MNRLLNPSLIILALLVTSASFAQGHPDSNVEIRAQVDTNVGPVEIWGEKKVQLLKSEDQNTVHIPSVSIRVDDLEASRSGVMGVLKLKKFFNASAYPTIDMRKGMIRRDHSAHAVIQIKGHAEALDGSWSVLPGTHQIEIKFTIQLSDFDFASRHFIFRIDDEAQLAVTLENPFDV